MKKSLHAKILPTKDEEKPTCKCKKCGKEYIVAGAYGTGNLKRHLELCKEIQSAIEHSCFYSCRYSFLLET
ncbi:hypothetical protein ACB092_12G163900 [Castanea dentata]